MQSLFGSVCRLEQLSAYGRMSDQEVGSVLLINAWSVVYLRAQTTDIRPDTERSLKRRRSQIRC